MRKPTKLSVKSELAWGWRINSSNYDEDRSRKLTDNYNRNVTAKPLQPQSRGIGLKVLKL